MEPNENPFQCTRCGADTSGFVMLSGHNELCKDCAFKEDEAREPIAEADAAERFAQACERQKKEREAK